jgi:ABC-2 type transport system permease protein
MSTLTADPTATTRAATSTSTAEVNSTLAGILRGEWIKLLSLRSTWWALTSTAALMTLASVAYAMSLNAMAEDPVTAPGIEQMHGAEIVASGFPSGC